MEADGDSDVTFGELNIRYGFNAGNEPRDVAELGDAVVRVLTNASKGAESSTELPGQWALALTEHLTPKDGTASIAEQLAERFGCNYRALELTEHYSPKLGSAVDDRTQPGYGVAILTNLPIEEDTKHPFGEAPGDPIERHGLQIRLRTQSGRPFNFIATQLTPLIWKPRHGYRQLLAMVSAQRKSDIPTISASDANQFGFVVESTAKRRGQKRAVKGRTWPIGRMFIPGLPQFVVKLAGKPPSLPALPVAQLDHILVPAEAQVLEANVVTNSGSDHHGVRAVVRIPHAQESGHPQTPQRSRKVRAMG